MQVDGLPGRPGAGGRRGHVAVMLALCTAAVAVAGPDAGAIPLRAAATTVKVSAGKPSELRFTLSRKAVPKGAVVFRVTNRGNAVHDFKIKGKVTRRLGPGESQTIRVTFSKAGTYRFLCTVVGHAAAGMKGRLVVR